MHYYAFILSEDSTRKTSFQIIIGIISNLISDPINYSHAQQTSCERDNTILPKSSLSFIPVILTFIVPQTDLMWSVNGRAPISLSFTF